MELREGTEDGENILQLAEHKTPEHSHDALVPRDEHGRVELEHDVRGCRQIWTTTGASLSVEVFNLI